MSTSATKQSAISRFTADPVSRRKFLAASGGSGAAAAFLAACGGDDESSTSSSTTTATASSEGTEQFGKGRPRDRQLRADARVFGGGLVRRRGPRAACSRAPSSSLHHAHTGSLDKRGPGEIFTMTVAEYEGASRLRRLGYRAYRNPVLMMLVGPTLGLLFERRFPRRGMSPRIPLSVVATNIALAAWAIGWAPRSAGRPT